MKKILLAVTLSIITLASIAQDKQQCQGKTKAGVQCKNKTESAYCRLHDPATPKCSADKKSGGKCQRIVKNAGDKCHDHKG